MECWRSCCPPGHSQMRKMGSQDVRNLCMRIISTLSYCHELPFYPLR